MERLAVYTSIDGEIYTKVIETRGSESYLLVIPQGRVRLDKHTISLPFERQSTELYVESGKERLLNNRDIVEKAFKVYTKDSVF